MTIHWIKDWTLQKLSIGIWKKSGSSTADDVLRELATAMISWGLTFIFCVAAVTDTDATMNLFGRILYDQHGVPWHGCVDCVLELTTGIAFKDNQLSRAP